MTRKRARLYSVLFLLLGMGVATTLVLLALRDNISYFRTPTDILSGNYPEQGSSHRLRLGGMVEKGSVQHEGDVIYFRVTDFNHVLPVRYRGIAPDLFREGQGVVADGRMGEGGVFIADSILAKHDEKYMPPQLAKALKQSTSSPTEK